MTLAFTGTESFPFRTGAIGYEMLRVLTAYGSVLYTDVADIRAQWASGTDAQVLDGLYTTATAWQSVHSSYLSALNNITQNNIQAQVNDDTPQGALTLSNALSVVIAQMRANAQTVTRGTTSATLTPYGSNKGDGTFLTSLTNTYGDPLDCVYPETIKYLCTADVASGAAQYQETFSITAPASVSTYAWNWPQGSGTTGSIKLNDSAVTQFIANGNFANFTVANAPNNWTLVTGVAGTGFLQDTTAARAKRGGNSLQLVSNGSMLLDFRQQLSASLVATNQVIFVNLWGLMSADDSSGVLTVRLCDGLGNTLVSDAGNNLLVNIGLNGGSGIGTSLTNQTAAFATPKQLPTNGVFLDIAFTVSPASAKTLNLSLIGVTAGQQLYPQGPWVAGFSAALPNARNDYSNLAITNSIGTATWVRFGQRFWGMSALGAKFYFPSVSGGATIPDSLFASP